MPLAYFCCLPACCRLHVSFDSRDGRVVWLSLRPQGCGALTPAWLDGADFLGIVPLFGRPAYKWRKAGLQNNYYYASADDRQARVLEDSL